MKFPSLKQFAFIAVLLVCICATNSTSKETGRYSFKESVSSDMSIYKPMDKGFSGGSFVTFKPSPWLDTEKKLYKEILEAGDFNLLLVPAQVRGYAVDRPNRALITRKLHAMIEKAGLRLPDPTFVSKALGYRRRISNIVAVYDIANKLNVEYLIVPHVGHDRNMRLTFTLVVQKRRPGAELSLDGEKRVLEWSDIPFSDSYPPAEALEEVLEEAISALRFKGAGRPVRTVYRERAVIDLPNEVDEFFARKAKNPIEAAYSLQLVGALYPSDFVVDEIGREQFFERSLMALEKVAPESTDYPLLKARANLYLRSRPAAIRSLGTPRFPAEKAFNGFLNGDITEMKKWTEKITSPLHRLIADIELNDLMWIYDVHPNTPQVYDAIIKRNPGWKFLVERRLTGKDRGKLYDSFSVKYVLDKFFPIEGYTVQDLKERTIALGEDPRMSAEIAFSVVRHYRKALSHGKKEFAAIKANDRLDRIDHLSLLQGVDEANMVRSMNTLVRLLGAYRDAIAMMDFFEPVYEGHPALTALKAEAIASKNKGRRLMGRRGGVSESAELLSQACIWQQGQTRISLSSCNRVRDDHYDGDFPRRWFWGVKPFAKKLMDRSADKDKLENYRAALLYTYYSYKPLEQYLDALLASGRTKESERVLDANAGRFAGNVEFSMYKAVYMEKIGRKKEARSLYTRISKDDPDRWGPYRNVAYSYLLEGKKRKALDLVLSYPLLSRKEVPDKVALSNNISKMGMWFIRKGHLPEAQRILSMAEELNTQSFFELKGRTYLALSKGDYAGAARLSLMNAKRHGGYGWHEMYMMLLALMGKGDYAWSIYSTLDMKKVSTWGVPLVAYRMKGVEDAEYIEWLYKNGANVSAFQAAGYTFQALLIDREPTMAAAKTISDVSVKFLSKRGIPASQVLRTIAVEVAEGYNLMRMKKYSEALEVFERFVKRFGYYHPKNVSGSHPGRVYILPYHAWTASKAGDTATLDKVLESFRRLRLNKGFSYELALAYMEGARGRHKEAITQLKTARNDIAVIISARFTQWYQLVEAAEILYADSGNDEYRKLAIEWARLYQKIFPVYSWAYAVEAKYSRSPQDRLRALALTLYLDKRSERISKISDAEKKRALKWLEKNNPFLQKKSSPVKKNMF